MHKWALGCVACSMLLSGCSVFQSETVNPQPKQPVNLAIPEGLARPNQPAAFDIPALQSTSPQMVDRRSPSLVLATATSSRLDEEEVLARVWFERNELTGELINFVTGQLQQFFTDQSVDLTQVDQDGLVFHTAWINRQETSGFWFWKQQNITEQARFALTLEPRPHGRSASLTVSLLEHRYLTDKPDINALDTKTAEVSLLNQVINQVAMTEALIARERRVAAPQASLEPGIDTEGNAVFTSNQPLDVVWSQLELLFPELNLSVTDLDRTVFTYYLSYSTPKRGFWRTVTFREGPLALPLADGDYQIQLSRSASGGTVISWQDQVGQPLAAAMVAAMYDPLLQAVRAAGAEL